MKGIGDLLRGIGANISAFGFILRNGMAWLFLMPALLWIVLAAMLFAFFMGPADRSVQWITDLLVIEMPQSDGLWKDVLAAIEGAREVLVIMILKIAIAYVLLVANKYIVLILLSPLLAYASERTEEIVAGRSFPFSWAQLMKDALRGAAIAARNGLLELSISIATWIFTLFLPLFTPFAIVVLFFVSSYFYGFSMFDHIFERRRMRVGETVKAVNERIGLVLGNGVMFDLLMKLPLIGMMIAPCMAAVGAVLCMKNDPLFDRIDTSHPAMFDRK